MANEQEKNTSTTEERSFTPAEPMTRNAIDSILEVARGAGWEGHPIVASGKVYRIIFSAPAGVEFGAELERHLRDAGFEETPELPPLKVAAYPVERDAVSTKKVSGPNYLFRSAPVFKMQPESETLRSLGNFFAKGLTRKGFENPCIEND